MCKKCILDVQGMYLEIEKPYQINDRAWGKDCTWSTQNIYVKSKVLPTTLPFFIKIIIGRIPQPL